MILTNSEIQAYQRCPTEWRLRYVEHRTGPATNSQSRGTRIHAWLAWWWGGCQGHEPTTPEPIEQAMLAGYAARWVKPQLTHVLTSVPFSVLLPHAGVTLVGEVDALGREERGNTIVVEHKTTTADISPGSQYWTERTVCDPQVSTYLRAFPRAEVLYDVLKVPGLRPLEVNSRRKVAETDDEYVARCLAAMAEEPDKYFQRATIVRLEEETAAFERDVEIVAESMVPQAQARNPKSCFSFGSRCDFFGVCWQGEQLDSLQLVEQNHTEIVLAKVQADKKKRLPVMV